MIKINFQDLPNRITPIRSNTLNQMQDNIEDAIDEVEGKINSLITNASNYTKFDDGTLICYGNVSNTSEIVAYYNTLTRTNTLTAMFPIQFISAPKVTISPIGHQTIGHYIESIATTGFNYRLFKANGSTETGCEIEYIAVGKWK